MTQTHFLGEVFTTAAFVIAQLRSVKAQKLPT